MQTPKLTDSIKKTINSLLIDLWESEEESGVSQISAKVESPKSQLVIVQVKSDKVPELGIYLSSEALEVITDEFHLNNSYFGEIPLLQFWTDFVKDDDEQYIVDTDVLNWEIQVGTLRDTSELSKFAVVRDPRLNELGDMPSFIKVRLNDWLS